ncbi:hypothetical protein RJ641_034014 [Dillenia turbinata]|uniref:Uncharacterized protein n=1 Tax=Dillenia turbinata TaxID=194707 RepID=A0AAN8VND4_9MAGN
MSEIDWLMLPSMLFSILSRLLRLIGRLEKTGVIFCFFSEAIQEYPDLVRKNKYLTVQNWYAGDEEGKGGIYYFVLREVFVPMIVETGSTITWKYPSVVLEGDDMNGEFYSVALTNNYQQAYEDDSQREERQKGLVQVHSKAKNARSFSQCDSMLIGDQAAASTYPYIQEAVKSNDHYDT